MLFCLIRFYCLQFPSASSVHQSEEKGGFAQPISLRTEYNAYENQGLPFPLISMVCDSPSQCVCLMNAISVCMYREGYASQAFCSSSILRDRISNIPLNSVFPKFILLT